MGKVVSRREFLKGGALAAGALAAGALASGALASGLLPGSELLFAAQPKKATVFFSKDISPAGLLKLYSRVNAGLGGRIAVKLHTGEPDAPNIIPRDMVKAFMANIPGSSIVECNVLYDSPRQSTEGHRKTIAANGWDFCPVDIMDAEGDIAMPIRGGKQLAEVAVGKNMMNYDSMLVLTHFKGHTMGGFGGSLKNISIGCASGRLGKAQLHSDGKEQWAGGPLFMERMVEGGSAITRHFGPRITYINVLRNMSVDCDCAGTAAARPVTPDIGIVASTDILAVDQASVDLVYALPTAQKRDLVERIESRSGLRQLEYMQIMGLGNAKYDLITV